MISVYVYCVLILFGFFIIHSCLACRTLSLPYSYLYLDVLEYLQSGDLILSQSNFIMNIISCQKITHVGLCIRINNENYIFEILPGNIYPSLNKIDKDYFLTCKSNAMRKLMVKSEQRQRVHQRLLEFIEMCKHEKYHHQSYIRGLLKKYSFYKETSTNNRGLNCSMLIMKALIYCKLVNRNIDYERVMPWDFVDKLPNCCFSPPVLIKL
jgi:hypothetical protein